MFKSIEEVQQLLISAIVACLDRASPQPHVGSQTVPGKDLEGFDSLCEIEVIVSLEEALGIKVMKDIFYSKVNGECVPRTVGQIAEQLLVTIAAKEKVNV